MPLSFKLADSFVESYATKPVAWGYRDAAGNSLGEITFLRTYSRIKPDGSKERWHEVCRRVIEWMYSEQKNHCKASRLPWNDHKAQRSAQDAYDRMFNFKWTPPGRGLWIAGTPMVVDQRNSAALQNCAYCSTADMTKIDPAGPFKFIMEALMLGIGVGFDDKGADKDFLIYEPGSKPRTFVIPDTREGWFDSVGVLLESYLMPDKPTVVFDYSLIRAAGEPIKTFGGIAAGPGPLKELHQMICAKFTGRAGSNLSRVDIADIGNQIGMCVVSGNVRRSAMLLLGNIDDKDFINLKNPEVFPERNYWSEEETGQRGWSWLSNNSVDATVGAKYDHLIDGIALNGEPGIVWMDTSRKYGRLIDAPNNKDHRATGYNPCLAGDSIIETVDGPKRIQDITEPTIVYSKGSDGRLTTAKTSAAFKTRENSHTLRINLQNGDELICTPDHQIMLKNGSWIAAQDLQPNDSLEVLCRTRRGWRYSGVRLSSQPPSEQIMEHRMIWEGVHGTIPDDFDIDHINREHHDNRIDNLRILPHSEHAKLSRLQVPNDHQVNGPNPLSRTGHGFIRSGLHGAKPLSGAIDPARSTGWKNQHTVTSVTEGPIIDVYDMTVDETHCFIANNVVVHNCAEQTLESMECCTLVETYLNRHESLEDFQKTLKYAFMYAKTVTLLPTHWERTNAIMQRNRRIGCSVSGVANFTDIHGLPELRTWLNKGYETVQRYDETYSEWLCVRQSIKTTTVKPSGTVSILAGESPGVHWAPGGAYFNRAIRLAKDDALVPLLTEAGYTIEADVRDQEHTIVAYFPIHTDAKRAEGDVTIFEKANLAVVAQRYWSDNSVSVTLSFDADTEAQYVGTVIHMHEGQLKTVSFLPMGNTVYPQQPYTKITEQQWDQAERTLSKLNLDTIYNGTGASDAVGEVYCTTDSCEIKQHNLNS